MQITDPFYTEKHIDHVKLVILDLDGTIADTIGSIRDGVNLTMKKYNMPERSYEEIRLAIGNGARELIRHSLPDGAARDEKLIDRALADYHEFYGQTYINCDHCYDGMIESLRAMKKKGYTIAVLSNKQDVYVKALVKALLPEELIACAAGQTDLPKKPDPTVPLMIAKKLGFSAEETAFVGDSEVDVKTALNAGMYAVGCAWGYRDRELLIRTGAHCILERAQELPLLFDKA